MPKKIEEENYKRKKLEQIVTHWLEFKNTQYNNKIL
jgi:hypothetical protein